MVGVASGKKSVVEHLLSKGADLDNAKGVLNQAISSGNLELVKFLWEEKGQRMYIPWGNPLYTAITRQYLDILKFLLESGLSPNEYQKMLPVALGLPEGTATQKEYKRVVIELLINYGAKM